MAKRKLVIHSTHKSVSRKSRGEILSKSKTRDSRTRALGVKKGLAAKLIDISPPITEKIAVFPGDQAFRRKVALDFKQGHHLLLSSIESTVHLGAHTDGPNHYDPKGQGIGERSLDHYLGACQVIDVKLKPNERILPKHLGKTKIIAPRVLFRTGSFPNPNQWRGDFNSLSPELVEFLADQGVITVGIDTPSIDPADSKGLESHQAVAKRNLAILEGIDLSRAKAKEYILIALPLRLMGLDASPVRAVLMPIT